MSNNNDGTPQLDVGFDGDVNSDAAPLMYNRKPQSKVFALPGGQKPTIKTTNKENKNEKITYNSRNGGYGFGPFIGLPPMDFIRNRKSTTKNEEKQMRKKILLLFIISILTAGSGLFAQPYDGIVDDITGEWYGDLGYWKFYPNGTFIVSDDGYEAAGTWEYEEYGQILYLTFTRVPRKSETGWVTFSLYEKDGQGRTVEFENWKKSWDGCMPDDFPFTAIMERGGTRRPDELPPSRAELQLYEPLLADNWHIYGLPKSVRDYMPEDIQNSMRMFQSPDRIRQDGSWHFYQDGTVIMMIAGIYELEGEWHYRPEEDIIYMTMEISYQPAAKTEPLELAIRIVETNPIVDELTYEEVGIPESYGYLKKAH